MSEVIEKEQNKLLFLVNTNTALNKSIYQLHYSNIDFGEHKGKDVYSYDADVEFTENEDSTNAKNKIEDIRKKVIQGGGVEITSEDFLAIGKLIAQQHEAHILSKLNEKEILVREKTKEFAEEFGIDSPRQLQFLVSLRKDIINNADIDIPHLEAKNKQIHNIFDSGMLDLIVDFCDRTKSFLADDNNTQKKSKNKM